MENLAAIFLGSFAIAFSGALMPGPLLTATISESARRGWIVGPLFMFGHGVLEMGLIAALFLGLAPLLTSDAAFIAIAFAGGSFMVWMAFGMFRSLPSLSLAEAGSRSEGGKAGARRGRSLALTGALMSLANPYWIIWWATIGLGYVLSSRESGFSGVAAFFLGHILADTLWYAFVSAAIHKGKKILPNGIYKGLIGVCATFLAGYAVFLIARGIQRI